MREWDPEAAVVVSYLGMGSLQRMCCPCPRCTDARERDCAREPEREGREGEGGGERENL